MVMLHIKLKRITNAATWLPSNPTLGMGLAGKNSTFLEHGHVAVQIKENHKCSNMAANTLLADPPPPNPGYGVSRSQFNFF